MYLPTLPTHKDTKRPRKETQDTGRWTMTMQPSVSTWWLYFYLDTPKTFSALSPLLPCSTICSSISIPSMLWTLYLLFGVALANPEADRRLAIEVPTYHTYRPLWPVNDPVGAFFMSEFLFNLFI